MAVLWRGAALSLVMVVWALTAPTAFASSPAPIVSAAGEVHASNAGAGDEMPVGIAPTADGRGFWVVTASGKVTPEGDATSYGDAAALPLEAPIVGMTSTPSGRGYWLVASDGGIFSFGDARFYGSTGSIRLAQPVVGMASTPSGHGYWLVAADGGIFTFGDAHFLGSAGGTTLPFPVLGMVATPRAQGYWLVLGNGQVRAFGDAKAIASNPVISNAACAGNPAGAKLLIVSITQQQLWACDGGQLASASAVTTGAYALPNVFDATPTGTWHITGKTTDVYLNGCNADGCWHDYVHYWVPFDGAYGFHDAPWQTFPYGSPEYATEGSHGCVHLPESEMAWVYSWAPIGTTVTIAA